jgi:Flp pilus assembly protein CpaB
MSQMNTTPPPASPMRQPTPPQQQANVPLILIAVALGLITVIATNWYVQKVKAERDLNMVTVYRLTRSIEPGQKLRRDDVTDYQVPGEFKESVVEGMNMISGNELSAQLGEEFRRYANTNAPLTWDLFTPPGQGGAEAVELAAGHRAIPIPVSKETAPPFLEPGMMVDINATLTPPGRKTETRLIMERVRVIAVGGRTQAAPDSRSRSYNTITVEVTPEESRALSTIRRYAEEERYEIVYRDSGETRIEIESGTIDPEVLRLLGLDPISDN